MTLCDVNGSPPQPLSLPFQPRGLPEWGPEGIVSAAMDRALYWVQPDGSGARQLRDPGTDDSVGTLGPTLIPGGVTALEVRDARRLPVQRLTLHRERFSRLPGRSMHNCLRVAAVPRVIPKKSRRAMLTHR